MTKLTVVSNRRLHFTGTFTALFSAGELSLPVKQFGWQKDIIFPLVWPAKIVKIDGLVNWVLPELEFIQSKLAAMIPYTRSAELYSLANYGRRYRSGQRISTAFMESAVNQLIDKTEVEMTTDMLVTDKRT